MHASVPVRKKKSKMCTVKAPCGNVLRREWLSSSHAIYTCLNGHHFISGHIPRLPNLCKGCGTEYEAGINGNQVYCSVLCRTESRGNRLTRCGHKDSLYKSRGLCSRCYYQKYEKHKGRRSR